MRNSDERESMICGNRSGRQRPLMRVDGSTLPNRRDSGSNEWKCQAIKFMPDSANQNAEEALKNCANTENKLVHEVEILMYG